MVSIQCTKENLLQGLEFVQMVAGKNTHLPILSHICLKAEAGVISLQATNLEIGLEFQIRGKIITDGLITIPGKILLDLIRNSQGLLEISGDQKQVKVTSDHSSTNIHTLAADDFPTIPWFEASLQFSINQTLLAPAIQNVIFAASTDQHRPELQSTCLIISNSHLDLVSTDGYRLAEYRLEWAQPLDIPETKTVLLPLKTAQMLQRMLENQNSEPVNFSLDEHQILVTCGSAKMLSRLLNGSFPDYKQILPSKTEYIIQTNTKDFLLAVKNAGLFCRPGIQDIVCTFKSNEVSISGSSDSLGQNISTVPIINLSTDITVKFNFKYLQDALQHINTENVNLFINHPHQPVIFTPDTVKLDQKSLDSRLNNWLSLQNQKLLIMPIKN